MAALREDEPLMVAEQDDPKQARGDRVWMVDEQDDPDQARGGKGVDGDASAACPAPLIRSDDGRPGRSLMPVPCSPAFFRPRRQLQLNRRRLRTSQSGLYCRGVPSAGAGCGVRHSSMACRQPQPRQPA